jgi:hypothetical protein
MPQFGPSLRPRALKIAALGALCALGISGHAHAMCHWAWGDGQQIQACDSSFDLPTMQPPPMQIPPLSLAPLPPLVIPPVGTSQCVQGQVWSGTQYQWQPVCR